MNQTQTKIHYQISLYNFHGKKMPMARQIRNKVKKTIYDQIFSSIEKKIRDKIIYQIDEEILKELRNYEK